MYNIRIIYFGLLHLRAMTINLVGNGNILRGLFVLEQVGNKARSLISIPKFGAYLL